MIDSRGIGVKENQNPTPVPPPVIHFIGQFWLTTIERKRGHSSFLLLFSGFPAGFCGNLVLYLEPHALPSEGSATTLRTPHGPGIHAATPRTPTNRGKKVECPLFPWLFPSGNCSAYRTPLFYGEQDCPARKGESKKQDLTPSHGKVVWKNSSWGQYPTGLTYLGDLHPISYHHSITAMTLVRTVSVVKNLDERLLVVADPVFQMDDDRAKLPTEPGTAVKNKEFVVELMNSIKESSGGTFEFKRLAGTGTLARNLQELYGSKADLYIGLKANKNDFFSVVAPQIDHYKRIIFATHGFMGMRMPFLMEPFLALTMVPEGTDGFLNMTDIMGLKMTADIVALTGCQTGLGQQLVGEGVMSMGRAFQYAGAKSVLMSLWAVAEKSSVQFIESVFKHLKEGKSKLEASRMARNEIRKAGYDHPFFWAPFILVGEVN